MLRNHADHRMLCGPVVAVQMGEIARDWCGEQGKLAFHQPWRARKGIGIVQCIGEVVEYIQPFNPLMHRRQRQLDFQHDAVAAVSMMQQQGLRRGHAEDARLGFHGHHFYAQHVAGCAQRAIVD